MHGLELAPQRRGSCVNDTELDIIEDPAIAQEALGGLQQSDPEVRQSALELLSGMELDHTHTLYDELLRVLQQLLANERIESIAQDALGVFERLLLEPREALTLPGVIELVHAPVSEVRAWLSRRIAEAPGLADDDPELGRLLALSLREEVDEGVVTTTMAALEALGNPLLEAELVELLAAPLPETRRYALHHLQPRAARMLPRLEELRASARGTLREYLDHAVHELRKPVLLQRIAEYFPHLRPLEQDGLRFYELFHIGPPGRAQIFLLLSPRGQRLQIEIVQPDEASPLQGVRPKVFLRRLHRLLQEHFGLHLNAYLRPDNPALVLSRTLEESELLERLPRIEAAAKELDALLDALIEHTVEDAFALRHALLNAQARKLERARERLAIHASTRVHGLGQVLWLATHTSPSTTRRAAYMMGLREDHLRHDASVDEMVLLVTLREGLRPGPSTERFRTRFARTLERRFDFKLRPHAAPSEHITRATLTRGLPVLPHIFLYVGHFSSGEGSYDGLIDRLNELARFLESFIDFIEQGQDPSAMIGLIPRPQTGPTVAALPGSGPQR